jgi:hypothetical protein
MNGPSPTRKHLEYVLGRKVDKRGEDVWSAVVSSMAVPCGPMCRLGPAPWLLLGAWADPAQRYLDVVL